MQTFNYTNINTKNILNKKNEKNRDQAGCGNQGG